MTQAEIRYRRGYKYQLAGDYHIDLPILGTAGGTSFIHIDGTGHLLIKEGYAWNGPSDPFILWAPISSMRASLVHDALYQLIRAGVVDKRFKPIADAWLEKLCIEDGMSVTRARLWHWAVSKFGSSSTRPSHEPPILIAP